MWTFLDNHMHVLMCIARDPEIRLRDIAREVDVTERTAHLLVADLVEAGYVVREKAGLEDARRNRYKIKLNLPLRHPLSEGRPVGELLAVLVEDRSNGARPARSRGRGSASAKGR